MPPDQSEELPAKGTPDDVPSPAPLSLDNLLQSNPSRLDRKFSTESERSLVPQSPPSENPLKNNPAPLDLQRTRERTRQQLASLLLGTYASTNLAVLIVAGIGYFYTPKNDQTYNLLTLLITSQTTLVGTALGFYFGDRKSDRD